MKQLPNIITLLRIAGSFSLLFCDVAGVTFLLLFIGVPLMLYLESIIPIVFIAVLATFAAVQEGHFIRNVNS
jgi:hypothetical protein